MAIRHWALFALFFLALVAADLAAQTPAAVNPSNTLVRFEIQRGTNALGSVDVELFDQDKPETVRNFLLYVWSGAYSNNFLHRCVPGFIVQGGGFSVTNPMGTNRFSAYLEVTNYGRLTNEFLVGPRLSNTFGTIAMAKVSGDTNSASSQWFFNLANNSTNLDFQNGGFTVFGRVLESTNANEGTSVLQHFNSLSTTGGVVNLGSLLGSTYNVFSSLPVSYTNTVNRAPTNHELYYVTISVRNRTNTPGQSPPSVSIVSPAPDSRFTNGTVTIEGTAADDAGVARVVYRVLTDSTNNTGSLDVATGTTNWQFGLNPRFGFNSVAVQSIDWDGNFSTNTPTVTFLYVVQVPLSLQKIGQGTIEGLSDGQLLQWGRFYTVTATPASGYTFGGWSGSVTSSTATLTFQVQTNATNFTLIARFNGNPFPSRAGTYRGLFRSTGTPTLKNSGFMSLTLQTDGLFSGKILHRGGTYTFTGQFDRRGNTLLQGVVGGVNRSIELHLDTTNTAGVITGRFLGDSVDVRLERIASTLPQENAPAPGKYTFVLPDLSTNAPSQLRPGGIGFGTASLAQNGVLTLSGRFADNRAFTTSSTITRSRNWPIYLNFLDGRGVFLGWLSFSTNQPANLDGGLQWVKGANVEDATYPSGFAASLAFLGSRYATPAIGQRVLNWVHGLARLQGADLLAGVTNLVKLTTDNTLVPAEPNPSALSLTLDPQTGLVQGSFLHAWAGTVKTLRGVVLPRTDAIFGQFVDEKQTGRLNLNVTPFLVTQSVVNVAGFADALSDGGLLRFETDGVISLTSPLPVKYHTALDANGHNIVVDGGGVTRLFEVPTNVNFSATGMVFANGWSAGLDGTAESPNGSDACGAGILNVGGTIGLTNCVLTNFTVLGGAASAPTASAGRALGAAICNQGGRVTLQGCQLSDNSAQGGAGLVVRIEGTNNIPISRTAGVALGGALYSESGQCEVAETRFGRNRVKGGEAQPQSSWFSAGDGAGGAIAITAGRLRARLAQFGTNIAEGGGATLPPGLPADPPVLGGRAHGGAVFAETNAEVFVEQSTFQGNAARGGSGAFDAAIARGGALASGGKLAVNASTFHENLAEAGLADALSSLSGTQPLITGSLGGAIFAEISSVAVTNSTMAFNRAAPGTNGAPSYGGALMSLSNSAMLVNLTVAFNEAGFTDPGETNATGSFGGGIASLGATVTLRNSIFASNAPVNLFGGAIDGGYNISSDDTADFIANTSKTRIDPLLEPLASNGGPTHTMAILPTSPARDAVTNNFPPVDQRGVTRPQGNRADVGAFEYMQTLPSFVISPVGGTNRYGSNFTFQASATGPTPIGFFWFKDGSPRSGGANGVLTITNLQVSDGGSYVAVATNSFGAVTSIVATLTVDSRPVLRTQPPDVSVAPGGSTNLVVVVDGPSLSYAWSFNDLPLSGATNSALTISNAVPGVQGTYQVVATNFAGSVTSRVARLSFNSLALGIVTQPQNLTVANGDPAHFEVLVSGISPYNFQWIFGGTPIPDATNSAFNLAGATVTNAGTYRVIITNAYLSVTSAPAVLTVVTPPVLSIAATPTNILITCQGDAGRTHRLLSVTNLGDTWRAVATNTLSGLGTFTWPRPLPTNGTVYYRAVSP